MTNNSFRPVPSAAYELYQAEGTTGLDLFAFLQQYSGETYAMTVDVNIKDSINGVLAKIAEVARQGNAQLLPKIEFLSPGCVNFYLVDVDMTAKFYARIHETSSGRSDPDTVSLGAFNCRLHGPRAVCEAVAEVLRNNTDNTARLKWFYTAGGNSIQEQVFFISDLKPVYDEFYPLLTEGVDAYFNNYFNSTANIMILLGPPGTGKTSLLRYMMYKRNLTAWFTYDERVLNSDNFYVDYITSKADVLVIEDADVLLTDRESGGNKAMAKLLNISDGLVKVMNKKIIFTANLTNKSKIDQALMRPGRCFDAIVLDELSREQAAAAAAKIGVQAPTKKYASLAEVFNNRRLDGSINNRDVDMSIGFGTGGYARFDD